MLRADTVPVVMYPARSVYEQVVPEGSFIHTDDFAAPYELAKHLETVYLDDTVFNKYLSWKDTGLFVKSWYEYNLLCYDSTELFSNMRVIYI